MKFIPLLFSTPMVQAEQAGRKTKTRRTKGLELINQNPDDWQFEWADYALKFPWRFTQKSTVNEKSLADCSFNQAEIKCPYGQVGDILWVRESHYAFGEWKKNGTTKTGKQKWKFEKAKGFENIRYEDNKPFAVESTKFRGLGWYKRSSLFLEKQDCRTFLEITNIRVERLQDISEEDARAEGTIKKIEKHKPAILNKYASNPEFIEMETTHRFEFVQLWQSINGPDSWEANPWVWVISFKRITKPENFC